MTDKGSKALELERLGPKVKRGLVVVISGPGKGFCGNQDNPFAEHRSRRS